MEYNGNLELFLTWRINITHFDFYQTNLKCLQLQGQGSNSKTSMNQGAYIMTNINGYLQILF